MFQAGLEIGPYTLIKQIGKGGFGEVWLAEKRSEIITKQVAVKLPHKDQIEMEAIRQEATLWERASGHSNVLPIIDADIYDGQVVIVSEYANGGSLDDKLKQGKLSIEKAVEMTIGILRGLEFLHSREIIHRDIKPANILLQNDIPRLADFGISRAMNADTVSLVVIGTDAYMSPEAFDGKRNVQTDIWSVGVVLYQMLKGKLPFPQKHPTERMFAILTKEFEALGEEIPIELRKILATAMEKKPEDRFQTAAEFRRKLGEELVHIQNPQLAPTKVFDKEKSGEVLKEVETIVRQVAIEEELPTEQKTVVKLAEVKEIPKTEPSFPQESVLTKVGKAVEKESVVTKVSQPNDNKMPITLISPEKNILADFIEKFSQRKLVAIGLLGFFIFGLILSMFVQEAILLIFPILIIVFLVAIVLIIFSVFFPEQR